MIIFGEREEEVGYIVFISIFIILFLDFVNAFF